MDTKMSLSASVGFRELLDAFDFVSASNDYDHQAYISIKDGTVHYVTHLGDMDEEVPEDIEESDQYINISMFRIEII
jgi:hypothetical protein